MSNAKRALATVCLVALGACSGGGTSSNVPQRTDSLAGGKLVLKVPARGSAPGYRRSFLSPSAASVSVAVTGIATPVVGDVSATSPECTASGGVRTCSIPVSAPVGDDTFVATLYAGADATGKILGVGTTVQPVSSGTPFAITIGVNGVGASVTLAVAQTQFKAGIAATTPLTVSVLDAGGNTITGTYQYPISITDSDTTGTFTVTPSTIASSTTVVTLAYSGGTAATNATISANGTNISAGSVSSQVVTVAPLGPFTLTPTALALLALGAIGTVTVVDTSGYTGTYTVSSTKPGCATATVAGKTVTVTAVAAGSTTLTVTSTDGRTASIPVTVTTTTIPIQ